MDCTKVIGYTYDGAAYCKPCYEASENKTVEAFADRPEAEVRKILRDDLEAYGGVIFVCEEWDSKPTCGTCNEEIEVSVIGEEV